MKIINARTGNLQEIPFALGEKGRGRWLEEVKVSNRPGQAPTGPDDVSFFVFGQDRKHVILTNRDEKRGILLRVNTSGVYTKGSCGSVALKGGKATLLTEGSWAEGDAGRVADGPDQLWHVEGPCLFSVVLQGGEYKGMGHRYLIVTRSLGTVMIKRAELCQLIATDENPEVTEVAKMFASELHEDVQQALRLAEELEEQMETPQAEVTHFSGEYRSIEEVVKGFGLAIPAAMGDKVKGVSSVQSGTLLPGSKALVALEIGPSGGKRYRFEKISETGLARVKESCERPYNRESVLAIVEDANWHSAWIDYKDGEPTAYVIANAGGIHSFTPNPEWGDPIRTQAWAGVAAVTPAEAEFRRVFNLGNGATKTGGNADAGGGFDSPFAKLRDQRW
ncbi:hypothetical protein EPN81_03135 [Patescibacteria group bacterium]|nr:MAG: hypothetical protein EPN81_03135 [Patescibacteria group bacterium]